MDEKSIPAITYYLKRHIALDGDEHEPAAESLLKQCINGDDVAEQLALENARQAIQSRISFWDGLAQQLDTITDQAEVLAQ